LQMPAQVAYPDAVAGLAGIPGRALVHHLEDEPVRRSRS
jgi:hypothetical protein